MSDRDGLAVLPDLWKLWLAEFYLAALGHSPPDLGLAGADADRAVAIQLPELPYFVRKRLAGEFPRVDPDFDAVMVERVGGTRTRPLIARLPCRAEDL